MVNEIILNESSIHVYKYEEATENGLHKISVDFKVTSEEYHDITTLRSLGFGKRKLFHFSDFFSYDKCKIIISK